MTDLIIDGNSLFARAWFATVGKDNNTPQDAIQAALNTLFSLLNVETDKLGDRVDRILIGWDGPNKRDKGRDPKPTEYHETREILIEYLDLLLTPAQVRLDTAEADDVVATAVHQSDANIVFVVSGDKDLQQLVGGNVSYYCLNTKGLLSSRAIRDKWHVKQPNQVAIALAIIGDKIDNIAGIKGWGPAKVKKLFEAVTPDMTLEQAICAIEAHIPEELIENFYSDLYLTMLDPALPGVPPAAPIRLAPIDAVRELQLPSFMEFYRPVHSIYRHDRLDSSGDEEDIPER